MKKYTYNRELAINYALKWALSRNPQYYNFDFVGGDCTSFISQCIYEGCKIMNYTDKLYGWYYTNANDKSPSWTGVEFLYNFLINNKGVGPYAEKSSIDKVEVGDVIQLKFDKKMYSHSLIITKIDYNNLDNIFVCSHTIDVLNKRLSKYIFKDIRFIHIQGFRK
ncbi:MAG: amidase [Clostridiales bacterium]|nr:amidase [Clostridiales bacterium]